MDTSDSKSSQLLVSINKLINDYFEDVRKNSTNGFEIKGISDNLRVVLGEIKSLGDSVVVPYSQVSQLIFINPHPIEDGFSELFAEIDRCLVSSTQADKEQVLVMHKILENLKLAHTQKQFLFSKQQSEIELLKEDYSRFSKKIETQTNEANQSINKKVSKISGYLMRLSSDTQKEVNTRINSLYSSFISVLGIFISISFTLFGAATLLNNIFSIATRKGFNTSAEVIGTNIILAGFATCLIYLLTIGLMQGIASVSNLRYDFSLRKTFIILFLTIGVVLMGLMCRSANFSLLPLSDKSWSLFIFIFLLSVAYFFIGLVLLRKGTNLKNWLYNQKFNFKTTVKISKQLLELENNKSIYVSNIRIRVRNKAAYPSMIGDVWIGDNFSTDRLLKNGTPDSILSDEYKIYDFNSFIDGGGYIAPDYLQNTNRKKRYLYIYSYSKVIKIKIKQKMFSN